jgi:hypothetical protein
MDFTTSFPFYAGNAKMPAGSYKLTEADFDENIPLGSKTRMVPTTQISSTIAVHAAGSTEKTPLHMGESM